MKLILVVDDDCAILDLLQSFLSKKYNVLCVDNALDAIKMSKRNDIDLLITDIRMPAMSGKELVEKIRHNNRNIKILFISGYITDQIIDKSDVDSSIDYIEKPFNKDSLIKKIEELLK